jgi:hypothetical protein
MSVAGIDQQLEGDGQVTCIARSDRHHGREIAAGAVAADRQAACIEAQRRGLAAHPARGGQHVVDGGGKAVFGAHAVVDRDHRAPRAVGQLPAQHVVRVEIADDPATAVVVHQHRQRAGARTQRPVQAHRDGAVRAVRGEVAHLGHFRGQRLRGGAALAVEGPRIGGRQRVGRRNAARLDEVEQGARLGMQHGVSGGSS